MNKHIIVFVCLLIGLSSCEKILMKPNPTDSNIDVFNEYATLVKEKYAMLEFKGVDIDFLIDSLGNLITPDMHSDTLFTKLAVITSKLHDAHSSLIGYYTGSFNNYTQFDLYEGYPIAFNDIILHDNYIGEDIAPNIKEINNGETVLISYGFLPQSSDIGYIRIPSFNIEITNEQIELIFSEIKNAKGCILDVRGNTGGDPVLSTKLATYFHEVPSYIGFDRFKTGPGVNDFTDSPITLNPASSDNRFLNPLVVLTDRGCYSATTRLCYSLNTLSQVTFMGQRTGGGSGSVADGFLSNGWQWNLSTSEFIDHLGNHLDDGVDPDIAVSFDILNTSRDELVDAAILLLQ